MTTAWFLTETDLSGVGSNRSITKTRVRRRRLRIPKKSDMVGWCNNEQVLPEPGPGLQANKR